MGALRTFPKDRISTYTAKQPNAQGFVKYSDEDNLVWQRLYSQQITLIDNHACEHFIDGLKALDLPTDRVPQCDEISEKMYQATGFTVAPVAALIPDEEFFTLLSQRLFPAATFMRRMDDFHYIQEPDLFHEYFGHCPMLLDPAYADFSQEYGKVALAANEKDRALLARLYWFTIEFGLVNSDSGPRAYGGGIISSPGELPYSTTSDQSERRPLTALDTFRTPYRIDMFQPIYYVIDNRNALLALLDDKIPQLLAQAQQLGDYEPTFPTEDLL